MERAFEFYMTEVRPAMMTFSKDKTAENKEKIMDLLERFGSMVKEATPK